MGRQNSRPGSPFCDQYISASFRSITDIRHATRACSSGGREAILPHIHTRSTAATTATLPHSSFSYWNRDVTKFMHIRFDAQYLQNFGDILPRPLIIALSFYLWTNGSPITQPHLPSRFAPSCRWRGIRRQFFLAINRVWNWWFS